MYRVAGDETLLIEYGDVVLDFELRFRVHLLEQKIRDLKLKGLMETAPGIRSLWIKYDPLVLVLSDLLGILQKLEISLPDVSKTVIPSRKNYASDRL